MAGMKPVTKQTLKGKPLLLQNGGSPRFDHPGQLGGIPVRHSDAAM
jgi:hypothetical protein